MSADERYNMFRLSCKNVDITKFKRDQHLRGIVENVSKAFGLKYLKNIQKYDKNLNWERIKELNDIGNPENEISIANNIEISPTTLRYVQFALDMLYHAKKMGMKSLRIVEVGGGYGFQSVLLYEFSKLFEISIDNYQILDLLEVNHLQRSFLKKADYSKVKCLTINEYSFANDNFFISNYALGEFDREWQNIYISKVVSKISHGFCCWNFSPSNPKIHEYFKNGGISIKEENPQTNCPPIKSYIISW